MATQPLANDTTPQKPVTKSTGDWGESIAEQHLVAQGYAIRALKWRCEHYEIDIIAQKGTRIIFVEVKTRKPESTDPAAAVNSRKRHNMIKAADSYLKNLNVPLDYQFDIIAITGDKDNYKLSHIADAFFPSPRTK